MIEVVLGAHIQTTRSEFHGDALTPEGRSSAKGALRELG